MKQIETPSISHINGPGQRKIGSLLLEGLNMTNHMQWYIDRLRLIAKKHGVTASIRPLGGRLYANINGVSFEIKSREDFEKRCIELKNYQPPAPINLTERLARIENAFVKRI